MKLHAALWGCSLLLLAQSAAADREKAAAAYKAATAAFARNAFSDAAVLFETAYAEDPRGGSIYNAALAWQNAHDDARAADDFTRAIAFSDLSSDLSDNAKAQLAKIAPTVGKLHVDGPADAIVSIKLQPQGAAKAETRVAATGGKGNVPIDVYLQPGAYLVHATYGNGSTGDFPVNAVAGAPTRMDVTPQPAAPPVVIAPPTVTQPEMQATGLVGPPTLGIGIGLIAAGAVAGGFAIGLGVATLDALSQYKSVNSGAMTPVAMSDHDQTVNLQAWTNVMLVTALVLGAAGIAAVVTVHRVKVHAAVGLGSLGLSGTF